MTTNNPSPKQVFQSDSARVKKHADLIARPELREALDVALRQYLRQCSTVSCEAHTPEAASFAWRLAGAQELVNIFYGLADITTPSVRRDPDNLIHQ